MNYSNEYVKTLYDNVISLLGLKDSGFTFCDASFSFQKIELINHDNDFERKIMLKGKNASYRRDSSIVITINNKSNENKDIEKMEEEVLSIFNMINVKHQSLRTNSTISECLQTEEQTLKTELESNVFIDLGYKDFNEYLILLSLIFDYSNKKNIQNEEHINEIIKFTLENREIKEYIEDKIIISISDKDNFSLYDRHLFHIIDIIENNFTHIFKEN